MSRQANLAGTLGESEPRPRDSSPASFAPSSVALAEVLPLPLPPLPPFPPFPSWPILWADGGGSSSCFSTALYHCWKKNLLGPSSPHLSKTAASVARSKNLTAQRPLTASKGTVASSSDQYTML